MFSTLVTLETRYLQYMDYGRRQILKNFGMERNNDRVGSWP